MYGTMVEINDTQVTDDIIVGYLNTVLKLQQNKEIQKYFHILSFKVSPDTTTCTS